MITCKQCGCEFLPIWREGYPGGAETGGTILVRAFVAFIVSMVLLALGVWFDMWPFYFFGALLFALAILRMWSLPDNRQIIISHGGNKCPNCGAENELRWYD